MRKFLGYSILGSIVLSFVITTIVIVNDSASLSQNQNTSVLSQSIASNSEGETPQDDSIPYEDDTQEGDINNDDDWDRNPWSV